MTSMLTYLSLLFKSLNTYLFFIVLKERQQDGKQKLESGALDHSAILTR